MKLLRKERGYSKIEECKNFWSWLWYEWRFVNKHGERQIGSRCFGIEVDEFYEIPMGELGF